ncbi:response regulator [Paenibacillus sp. J5C_2022]|uniref:response regulator transcription factor n=1 Tax=Paenibacillus sp. J5C2022 TaxID=2977129 RepID=UPI0021D0F01B|nr:response regulator [Paenibacillus sp. J5C2022]MCU6712524.1 response regulator [Paenibacillus sp. J5C2022]
MFKILIVDDEMLIREGIKSSINWHSLNIKQANTAKDGEDAYKKAAAEEPDIIITDIKMPKMNGLELIRKLRKEKKETRFVVLSGYGEFQYAQQAMSDGVRHYLLKPTNIEEITKALTEITGELAVGSGRDDDNGIMPGNDVVQQMLELVRLHYSKETLSLGWIAKEKLFMNTDYLGKLFKKELGESFSQYLMKYRMTQARELLMSPKGWKVYEIAERTGFGTNPQYFAKVFKKTMGITPHQYKQVRRNH